MIDNFEQWKRDLLRSYDVAIHGNAECEDRQQQAIDTFCACVDAAAYNATEEEAEVLFSLFSDDEDYELLEAVVGQLEGMRNEAAFVRNLLKAFPRLAREARKWAETFAYALIQLEERKRLALASADREGKLAIIGFIQALHSPGAFRRYEAHPKMMQEYIEDLKKFDEFALELERSIL